MNFFSFSLLQFQSFLLIFSRVGSMLYMMPVIGAKVVPHHFRIGLALLISFILLPLSQVDASVLSYSLPQLAAGIFGEVMVGFIIGLAARLLFAAIEIAGELMGFQMGISVVNVINPEGGIPVPILGQFYSLMAMSIFLGLNAHHYFLQAIGGSFTAIPPFHFGLSESLWTGMASLAGEMFVLALKIGAPVVVSVLMTNLALNIISRTVPQMNILVVGLPITMGLGFLMMAMSMGVFGLLIMDAFQGLDEKIQTLLEVMGR
jgi:flagellar biosynthetic protein FliR